MVFMTQEVRLILRCLKIVRKLTVDGKTGHLLRELIQRIEKELE